jgi:hypothetical protein
LHKIDEVAEREIRVIDVQAPGWIERYGSFQETEKLPVANG